MFLKGQFTQLIMNYLFTTTCSQLLLQNTKEDILKNANNQKQFGYRQILKYIILCSAEERNSVTK